jgi:16S rRNA (cytosine967-C5)-methyltransferase
VTPGDVDVPRATAYEVLQAVSERQAYANLLLPQRLRAGGLDGRDAAFATELTYGTLRRLGTYDAICAASVSRAWPDVDPKVKDALRLGAHQLLGMRVARHAAVTTSVELAGSYAGKRSKGFVNAVLRKVSARDYDSWVDEVVATRGAAGEATEWTEMAVRHAHPEWLVSEFARVLEVQGGTGDSPTALPDLLAADNAPPEVTLVAWPGRSDVGELQRAGCRPGRWSPYAARLSSGDPADLAAVREQRAGVQDEGSQLAALALTAATTAGSQRERWLDMCAGPGGKAALLSAVASSRGATLEAWEIRPQRAALVKAVAPDVTVRTVDAADPERLREHRGSFDRVLVDAPCSGAGALRRRPEARWRKQPSDVRQLAAIQKALLGNALGLVRPGGVVAYVTCSPLAAETREVVDDVVGRLENVERLDARSCLPSSMPALGKGPDVQLWPHLHETDAMYVSLLRRRA